MQGKALSGGDRIFIELSKRWSQKLDISIFLSKEGAHICRREDLNITNQNIVLVGETKEIIIVRASASKANIIVSHRDTFADFAPSSSELNIFL